MHMAMISDETQIQKFADWSASRVQSVTIAVTMTNSQRIWNLMSKKSLSTLQINPNKPHLHPSMARKLCMLGKINHAETDYILDDSLFKK